MLMDMDLSSRLLHFRSSFPANELEKQWVIAQVPGLQHAPLWQIQKKLLAADSISSSKSQKARKPELALDLGKEQVQWLR